MQYAKSMYLWGEFIDAEECDYSDYKELGLVCPCCYEPVFLVKGGVKTSKKGKEFKVRPFFSHYSKDEQAELCEQRTLTSEFKSLVKYASTESRNQRLDLFTKHFTEIFWIGVYPVIKAMKIRLSSGKNIREDKLKRTIYRTYKSILKDDEITQLFDFVTSSKKALINDTLKSYRQMIKKHGINDFINETNRMIALEVLQYLLTPKSRDALAFVFTVVSLSQNSNLENNNDIQDPIEALLDRLIGVIIVINWQGSIDTYSSAKFKGFSVKKSRTKKNH